VFAFTHICHLIFTTALQHPQHHHSCRVPPSSESLIWFHVSDPQANFCSWDDWVPEDRLRKLSPENRELANNLRHEVIAAQRAARAQPPPPKKKAQGSARGSEERQTSVSAAAPRGQKRMRDNDLEKVSFRLQSLLVQRLLYHF
jgi:hypothetical protein